MSDKIINGIDVSECAYFNSATYEEPYCNIDQEHLYTCSSDENCYFKQLKRLQEENKRLQMLSCANCGEKYLSPDGVELYEKNVQLQEENEKLKEKVKNYKLYGSPTLVQPCNHTNTEYDLLVLENRELKEKIKSEKYIKENALQEATKYSMKCGEFRQALKEIREMILGFGNTPIEFKTLNIPLKEEDLKTNEGKFFDFYTKLKDKINEVFSNE